MGSDIQLVLSSTTVDKAEAPKSVTQLTKWGSATKAGFQIIPNVLFRAQQHLELDATEVVILLNLTLHWWDAQSRPFPSPGIIAKRMGVSRRTIERRLEALEKRGFIKRSSGKDGSKRRFDLSGMVKKLESAAEVNLVQRAYARSRAAQSQ